MSGSDESKAGGTWGKDKARLVARSFKQSPGEDFYAIYAPLCGPSCRYGRYLDRATRQDDKHRRSPQGARFNGIPKDGRFLKWFLRNQISSPGSLWRIASSINHRLERKEDELRHLRALVLFWGVRGRQLPTRRKIPLLQIRSALSHPRRNESHVGFRSQPKQGHQDTDMPSMRHRRGERNCTPHLPVQKPLANDG